VSGDVRKALQICRQACELARAGGSKVVTLSNIEMAVKQLYTNPYVAAIKGISLLERVVVVATAQALKDGIMAFTSPKAITQNAIGTCRSLGVCVPTHGLVSAAIARLIDIRLLQCGQGGDKLELCVQRDDVAYALKDDPLLKKIASACA
jgi:Cdc6-like AAA superfamily ATPase